jgi:hypothetical protein
MEPPRFIAGAQAEADAAVNQQPSSAPPLLSKKVSDHLWLRGRALAHPLATGGSEDPDRRSFLGAFFCHRGNQSDRVGHGDDGPGVAELSA